jgi:hypothetical protein
MSAVDKAVVLELRKGGLGVRAIARHLGVSLGVIAGILFRAGLTSQANHVKFTGQSAASRERMSEGCKTAWRDPEKRARRLRLRAAKAQAAALEAFKTGGEDAYPVFTHDADRPVRCHVLGARLMRSCPSASAQTHCAKGAASPPAARYPRTASAHLGETPDDHHR